MRGCHGPPDASPDTRVRARGRRTCLLRDSAAEHVPSRTLPEGQVDARASSGCFTGEEAGVQGARTSCHGQ